MATAEDANLILKLYELRREEKLREARAWFLDQFQPESVDEIMATVGSAQGAYLRMVVSYWDMAAAMVNHGAIDRDLFCDSNGEQFAIFAKLEPFLAELRQRVGNPTMFQHLEKLTNEAPQGRPAVQRWQARWAAQKAAKAATNSNG